MRDRLRGQRRTPSKPWTRRPQHRSPFSPLPKPDTPPLLRALTPRPGWTQRARRTPDQDLPIREAPPTGLIAQREGLYRRLLVAGDALAAAAALQLVVGIAYGELLKPGALAALASLVLVNKLSGLYDRDELVLNRSTLDELPQLLQISGLFSLSAWLLHNVVTDAFLHQTDVLALWCAVFFCLVGARAAARFGARRWTAPERCLVVGEPALAERLRLKLRDSHVKAEIVTTVPMPDGRRPTELPDQQTFFTLIANFNIQRVIVAPGGSEETPTLEIVRMAKAAGLRVSLLPRLLEVVGSSVEFDDLDGLTMLGVRRFGLSRSSLAVKRTLDLAGAAFGLVAVAPLLAIIAVAIRLDNRGPVFFRQTRVGRDGRRFEMIKFRSMVADAEELKASLRHRSEATELFKIADDPRITRVGRLLRRTSLDELPQLFNVLKGEMSLVGPRPLVEEEDAMVLGFDRSRLHLTPGMTGHWQVLGSARIPMDEMMTIDYLYVANWSLWTDIKILLRTVVHVFARGGM